MGRELSLGLLVGWRSCEATLDPVRGSQQLPVVAYGEARKPLRFAQRLRLATNLPVNRGARSRVERRVAPGKGPEIEHGLEDIRLGHLGRQSSDPLPAGGGRPAVPPPEAGSRWWWDDLRLRGGGRVPGERGEHRVARA